MVSAASLPLGGIAAGIDSPAAAASASPPRFPDEIHVMNGCYLSTVAYVARFRAEFPAEQTQPLTVELKAFHGQHAIAVLSWHGAWWGRKEYFGVFAHERGVSGNPEPDRARRRPKAKPHIRPAW